MLANLRAARVGVLFQQILRGHQHTRCTVAALQGVPVAKSSLKVGDFVAVGQALDSLYRSAMCLHRKYEAGPNDLTVELHRAGTHTPCSQPTCVPVRCKCSRKKSARLTRGETCASTRSPFTSSEMGIGALTPNLPRVLAEKAEQPRNGQAAPLPDADASRS